MSKKSKQQAPAQVAESGDIVSMVSSITLQPLNPVSSFDYVIIKSSKKTLVIKNFRELSQKHSSIIASEPRRDPDCDSLR